VSPSARRTASHRTFAYGDEPDQAGDLRTPDGEPPADGWPVAVLLHGGFWRERYRRDLMDALAADLVGRGVAVWNLEYRRVRGAGGWPRTFVDVAAGIDRLAGLTAGPLDLAAVTVIGHSAGGHLALWVAGRALLPEAAPGASPVVRPAGVVALAPVADLRAADAAGLSDAAVRELLGGGPEEHPARWRVADPVGLVGHGVPVLLVHGTHDEDVPPAQSERYRDAGRQAGDRIELVSGPWDHMDLVDPTASAWPPVLRFLLGAPPVGRRPGAGGPAPVTDPAAPRGSR
jgi:acetyl esterase/lipase